jgi:hypothetical protein
MKRNAIISTAAAVAAVAALAPAGASAAGMPDLKVTSLAPSALSVQQGGSIDIRDITVNRGGFAADASATAFALSRDAVISADDLGLEDRDVRALRPGRSSRGYTSPVRIPANTAAGAYFLIACADSDDEVEERNENNNCRRVAITVTAAPATVAPVTQPTPAPQPAPAPAPAPQPVAAPPAAPVMYGTNPASPSTSTTPMVVGRAVPNARVNLYATSNCSGAVAGTDYANANGDFAIRITVQPGQTVAIRATATVGTQTSACSTTSASFTAQYTSAMTPRVVSADYLPGNLIRFVGQATPGAQVFAYVDAACPDTAERDTVADANGRWEMVVTDRPGYHNWYFDSTVGNNIWSGCSTPSVM